MIRSLTTTMNLIRRSFVAWSLSGTLVLALSRAATGQAITVTGTDVPSLAPFDQAMTQLMNKYQIPGAQLAVSVNGRLVLAHGYGLADVDSLTSVQPDSLFRIDSLSKQLTAVAILQLVQNGELGLDDPAFGHLSELKPPKGAVQDPRLSQITIRNLLQHSGGWNRNVSPDPMFAYSIIAATALGEESPASSDTIIRYMMGQPLDFDPGTTSSTPTSGTACWGEFSRRSPASSMSSISATTCSPPSE